MISKFFIERPIFANVIALVTVLVGAVFLYALPVAQYPEIVPPTIQVSTRYPGASAEVVAATIGVPLEQASNGVETGWWSRRCDRHECPSRLRKSVKGWLGKAKIIGTNERVVLRDEQGC